MSVMSELKQKWISLFQKVSEFINSPGKQYIGLILMDTLLNADPEPLLKEKEYILKILEQALNVTEFSVIASKCLCTILCIIENSYLKQFLPLLPNVFKTLKFVIENRNEKQVKIIRIDS